MADKFVSGEEFQALKQKGGAQPSRKVIIPKYPLWLVAGAVVLCGVSFVVGTDYQKGHDKSATTMTGASLNGGAPGGAGGGFARRGGGVGQVTAISPTSITIDNQRSGASQTFTISSSTTISDNGQTVDTTGIKSGDTVLVSTSGSGSTDATRIMVNPSFGGGPGGFGGSQSGSTSTTTQSN